MQLHLSIPMPPLPAPATTPRERHDADGSSLRNRRLPALYYLQNFSGALESLRERYGALLSDAESAFIRGFACLPDPSRCLLARMLMRKGPMFRRTTLTYPEIGEVAAALRHLTDCGWAEDDPLLSMDELSRSLSHAEWRHLFGKSARRDSPATDGSQLALPLSRPLPAPRPLSQWHALLAGTQVRLSIEPLARRLQFLYFGNEWQTWAAFVISDLGLRRYEKVPYAAASCAFSSRDEIEHFYRLNHCVQRLRDGEAAASIVADAYRPEGMVDWLDARFAGFQLQLGEVLRRQGEHELASSAYCASATAAGRIRMLRLQEQQGRYAAARQEAATGLQLAGSEAEHRAMARALKRLRRRLGEPVENRETRPRPEVINLAVRPHPQQRVERQVCAQLSTAACPAFYVENGLFPSLFALLCWDAVFAPLPGAFFHPFQDGPADLYTREFRSRRAAMIAAQLALLDSGQHEAVIRQRYRDKAGISAALVSWGKLKPQVLSLALACIPASHLKLVFERLLDDLGNHCTGLPDLVQFMPEERRYQLLEVKAPGDRLQDNQRLWMEFFARNGMPAAVCRVTWTVDPPAAQMRPA
jgi:hypothetical protein